MLQRHRGQPKVGEIRGYCSVSIGSCAPTISIISARVNAALTCVSRIISRNVSWNSSQICVISSIQEHVLTLTQLWSPRHQSLFLNTALVAILQILFKDCGSQI